MADVEVSEQIRRLIEEAKQAAETDPTYLIDMLKSNSKRKPVNGNAK